MALNAAQITVASMAHVYVAPIGTALPTDTTTVLAAGFVELGYVTEDGISFSVGADVEDIMSLQKLTPVRRLVTGRPTTLSFTLMQWATKNFSLAFGGGTVTEPDAVNKPGEFRYDPPADSAALADHILVAEWNDGADKKYRIVVYRGNVTDAVETTVARTAAAILPISFAALTPDNQSAPWYLLTDDVAFDPTPA